MDLPGNYESIPRSYFVPADSPAGESGLKGEYFTGTSFAGEPFKTQVDPQIDFDWNYRQPVPGLEHDKFSVRWTGQLRTPGDGSRQLAMASFGPAKLYVDGLLVLDLKESNRHEAATVSPELQAGRNYDIKVEYAGKWGGSMCRLGWMRTDADPVAEAAQLASECDIAIVFAGLSEVYEGESFDRSTLALPGLQNKLIEAVAKANPRTIVVLNNGTPILMDWKDNVAAIVEAWYPGQEGGLAIAEVLFGEINPSGKLPFTFPKCWNDHSAYGNFPGKDGVVKYVESIFVGYRHFDLKEIEPLFPFGHGLSYTQFDYKDITISPGTITRGENVNVSVTLKNTGKCYGSEVVQLYIRDIEAAVARPMKELKGISKISLEPGETKKASFTLQPDAFSYYDSLTDKWITEPGKFIIMAGSSSRDIRLKKNVQVN
jgi:beta-glucosidase